MNILKIVTLVGLNLVLECETRNNWIASWKLMEYWMHCVYGIDPFQSRESFDSGPHWTVGSNGSSGFFLSEMLCPSVLCWGSLSENCRPYYSVELLFLNIPIQLDSG